ncbi:unnamed protein product [Miscanthus lutarioriparius]|uniref:Uncharacterized protein n=1 Tax=Miscanthus lutarioriparius TaxID=422564 RepID=A0A811SFD9_9POAL|nr:unnamed protein product [Miscanthus lutarioriparius]
MAAAGSQQTGAREGDTAGAAAASGPRVCPVDPDPSYLLPCVCCCPWLRDGPNLHHYGRAEVVRPGTRAVAEGGVGGEAYEGKKPAGSAAGSSMLSGVVSSIPRSPATMLARTRRTCLSPCLTALGWAPPRGLADLPARASEFARISRRSMAARGKWGRKGGGGVTAGGLGEADGPSRRRAVRPEAEGRSAQPSGFRSIRVCPGSRLIG